MNEIREKQIKDILASGKVARFHFDLLNITKDVKEWNPDEDGDLSAFRKCSNCWTEFVFWSGNVYEVTAVDIETPIPTHPASSTTQETSPQ